MPNFNFKVRCPYCNKPFRYTAKQTSKEGAEAAMKAVFDKLHGPGKCSK